jgi:hypothetical protein
MKTILLFYWKRTNCMAEHRIASVSEVTGLDPTAIHLDWGTGHYSGIPAWAFLHIRASGFPERGGAITTRNVGEADENNFLVSGGRVTFAASGDVAQRQVLLVPKDLIDLTTEPRDRGPGYYAGFTFSEARTFDLGQNGQLLVGPVVGGDPEATFRQTEEAESHQPFEVERLATIGDEARMAVEALAIYMGVSPEHAALVAQQALDFEQ